METKINPSVARIILVTMAAASLFVMLSLSQINYIVHGDLYNYGLRFSYAWAMPYWVLSGIIFGLCWVNIAITALTAVYVFKKRREVITVKQEEQQESVANVEENEQRKIVEFTHSQIQTQEQEPQIHEKIDSQQTGLQNDGLQQTQTKSPTSSQPGRPDHTDLD